MIGILTDPAIGGTFLTWSVYYLRGDDSYFLAEESKKISLTDNPVTKLNAHNFIPNTPNRGADRGVGKLHSMVKQLSGTNEVIYMHNFASDNDTKTGVEYLSAKVDKIILLTSKQYPLYHCGYASRSEHQWISQTEFTTDPDIAYNHFVNNFFAKSQEVFENAKLTNVWDKREFIALNFKPYLQTLIDNHLDHNIDHYIIDLAEACNQDTYVLSMFDYLNLEINKDRYASWKQIYQQWQKLHCQRMKFVMYFDIIVDYIVNGYNLDLTRFDLDIVQEATIQYELIHSHNLNLKTWQLEKFTNTKQLHELLEPNIHAIQ